MTQHRHDPRIISSKCRACISAIKGMREALEAIQARVQGVYDNPALMKFGPLLSIREDVEEIARAALAAYDATRNAKERAT